MSRIGRSPIPIPANVSVTVSDRHVTVKGPQGTLERDLPGMITVREDTPEGASGPVLLVERPNDERANKALHGLTRSLVANMVTGVSAGFSKEHGASNAFQALAHDGQRVFGGKEQHLAGAPHGKPA